MFKNRNFWLGILIAVALVTAYKTVASGDKKEQSAQTLTLWDIGYVPTSPAQNWEDLKLSLIQAHDSEDVQPVSVKVSFYKGKPMILHLWATWCGPCVAELPHYDHFAQSSKVVNIAVSTDQAPPHRIREYCLKQGIKNVQLAVDEIGTLNKQLSAPQIPTTIFINAQGQEIGRIVGPVAWNNPQIATLIEEHIASKM